VVTIKDVAKESGFSSTTVSVVLNNAPSARYQPVTQSRILHAAKKLGYRPNLSARSLRSSRSHTVGVMVFDMTDPYCTPILRGIENSLYQESYLPILTDVQNERTRFERYLEMLLGRRVEGLVVLANWMFANNDLLADLQKHGIPSVVIGKELHTNKVSSIMVDNEAGGQAAVEHLCSLGHRKIAFVHGPPLLPDSAPRWKGIISCAAARRLEIDPALVMDLPESSDPRSSFEATYAMVLDLLKRKREFSAVLAFDDMSALGAMRALAKAGLRVPEDVSVIGFDDIPPARLCTPQLTTIRQPMAALGSLAVNALLDAIGAKHESRDYTASHHQLTPELVVRESTAPIK
jgi:LacI family transcriptional regulator